MRLFLPVFVLIVIVAVSTVGFLIFYILITPEVFPNDECTMGWLCKDYYHKAYRGWDCSWTSITECLNGCESGECLGTAPTTCTEGWTCASAETKGYHNADCSWSELTYCPNGCEDGSCLTVDGSAGGSDGEGSGNGSGGGDDGDNGEEPDFWAGATPEDFIKDGLSIILLANNTGPCERDSAIAESPAGCSGDSCQVYLYIYGFQDETCAENVFDIDTVGSSDFADFSGSVYLMEIAEQRLVRTEQEYPEITNYGYIWQQNRFVFTMEGNNDIYLVENLGWMVSRYSEGELTLQLIEVLK